MTTIDVPDTKLPTLANQFDNLAGQAEAASLSTLPTVHNRFVRAWMRKDPDGMTAQITVLQEALA